MSKSSPPIDAAAPHLLVVDDDARLRNLLREFLSAQGFHITTANDASDARAMLARVNFDLLILDVMMPGEDGVTLAADLRQRIQTPILFLTARGETTDRIAGLRAGADDYLAKPFEPEELVLRLQAILRRGAAADVQPQSEYQLGPYRWSPEMGELHGIDGGIKLSDMENKLLRALASRPGQALSRETLAELMGIQTQSRSIDVMVVRLRRKLGDDPAMPRILQTLRGQGYVLRIT